MVSERIIMQEREKSDCRENHVFFFRFNMQFL